MLERLGPRIWDRIGPGIGGKYWDDPNKQHTDGSLLYSSIERAASTSAWVSLAQAILCTPLGLIAAIAAVTDPAATTHGGAIVTIFCMVGVTVLAYVKLVEDIRWTQLTPTMGADGTADDLYGDDEDEDEEEEGEDGDYEEEPEEDESDEESNIVPFEEDSWGSAS